MGHNIAMMAAIANRSGQEGDEALQSAKALLRT